MGPPSGGGACVRHGITAVAPWRDQVAKIGLAESARVLADSGLRVTGLCRGGMFTAADAVGRLAAIDDNRRAIDEAATLGADCLVFVVGGLPPARATSPAPATWSPRGSRRSCRTPAP